MKHSALKFFGSPLVFFLMLLSLGLIPSAVRAGDSSGEDWNVAVLDELLTSVQPGQAFVQIGDMEISVSYLQSWRNQLAGGPQPKIAFKGTFNKWTGGNVYYAFDASVTASNQRAFLDAAAEWATFADLHFIARTAEANYILVTNNPTLGGGNSFVGMVGGAQLLQMGPNAWNRHTLCHELGHALGLVHEHQRSDRDSFVTIDTDNVTAGHLSDFVLLTDSQNKSTYDFLSVMHYARNAFSVDVDSNTIVPLPAYTQYLNVMGDADPVLSAADRASMAAMYGAGPGTTNIVTNTQDGGPGSLRAALYYANDHPGTTVAFDISTSDAGFSNNVFNILPTDGLPGLYNDTVLDGSTEPVDSNPAGPDVLLNGVFCQTPGVYTSGLQFKGTNSVARSFVINNFPSSSVAISGSNTVGNTISGCYLGIDPTGTMAVTNGFCPVLVSDGAVSNTVGGTTVAARNVIGGSAVAGVYVRNAGTRFNTVEGNYIGLNAAGTAALPNAYAGIKISGGAQFNLVGGDTAAAGNFISGNTLQGVLISDVGTTGNRVAGNWIGLNAAGTVAISNGWAGVEISGGASANVVGFSNVISGNGQDGVLINNTSNNVVRGNFIGLDATGTFAISNGWSGVDLYYGAQSNIISAGNAISGNGHDGVILNGAGTSNNVVQGNFIGLDIAGTASVSNGWAGVDFYYGPQFNQVGGVSLANRNVISGNGRNGVQLSGEGTTDNVIAGNFVGLGAAGTSAIANGSSGIEIYNGASANFIGGAGGARNFISGNGSYGVLIDFGSSGNIVQGNTIGLDGVNKTVVPNADVPVLLYDAASNLIGGVTSGAANLISGSTGSGVLVYLEGSTNNTIRGNSIFDNTGNAIFLYSGGNHNLAAPLLTSAVVTTNTVVSGSYNGIAGADYELDFYADAPPAGSAESMTYLGSTNFTGTGSSAGFTMNLGTRLPTGRVVTATATDPAGNTSQLSTGKAATMTSTPNDGIPDAWRALYFGGNGMTTNSQSASFADPDHDGQSNYQEFLAGTNPNDGDSVLKLVALNPNLSANVVSLNSANGTVYRVQYRDDLTGGAWSILADQVVGNGTNIFLPDAGALEVSQRFYRAQVLW